MADLRPPVGPPSTLFGVPATVTPYGGAPISTAIIWAPPQTDPDVAVSALVADGDLDYRRRLAVRRDHVTDLPRGSRIAAPPPEGGADQDWTVDRVDDASDPDFLFVVVS